MTKQRFVFDCNIIISAFLFKKSKPRFSLEIAKNKGIILLSDSIIEEVTKVIKRLKFDRYICLDTRQELLKNLIESSLIINPREIINECRDSKDNQYLELAVDGKAESIITGDQDLLVLHPFRGINIIKPDEFLLRF